LACVLEDAALFLGALWLLAAGAGDSTVTDAAAGVDAADASMAAIAGSAGTDANVAMAVSLEPAAATSAVTVETESEEIAWTSSTGASTIGDWVAVTSGIGAASFCESDVDDWEGREKVSIDEPPETKDCEAPICLGLTVYRTTATPTPVPKSMVSICSKTILPVTPDDRSRRLVICGGVKAISLEYQNATHRGRRPAVGLFVDLR